MRPITKIIIQLVDVKDVEALISQHLIEKSMPEVGFHYMIESDGAPKIGRAISLIGNHLTGYNADSIGVACIGKELSKKHELAIYALLEELSIKGIDTSNVFLVEGDELKKYK